MKHLDEYSDRVQQLYNQAEVELKTNGFEHCSSDYDAAHFSNGDHHIFIFYTSNYLRTCDLEYGYMDRDDNYTKCNSIKETIKKYKEEAGL